jgi:hypothetical protein
VWIFAVVGFREGGRFALLAPDLLAGSLGVLVEVLVAFLKL